MLDLMLRKPLVLVALLFGLYAIVGTLEFRELREQECREQGLVYAASDDICQKP